MPKPKRFFGRLSLAGFGESRGRACICLGDALSRSGRRFKGGANWPPLRPFQAAALRSRKPCSAWKALPPRRSRQFWRAPYMSARGAMRRPKYSIANALPAWNGRWARIMQTFAPVPDSPTSRHYLPIKVGQVRQKACWAGPHNHGDGVRAGSSDIATRVNNLAHAISARSASLEEAGSCIGARWPSAKRISVAAHPAVAIVLDNVGAILHQSNRFAEADLLHAAHY